MSCFCTWCGHRPLPVAFAKVSLRMYVCLRIACRRTRDARVEPVEHVVRNEPVGAKAKLSREVFFLDEF